jgi:hypothetical protein
MNAAPSSWSAIAASADGNQLVATVNGGGIYLWQNTPPPQVINDITLEGSDLVINASNGAAGHTYVVLTSTDLTTGDWVPVATNSLGRSGDFTITATNGVSPDASQQFYRLKAQ